MKKSKSKKKFKKSFMLFSFISKALISLHSREKNLSSLHFIFDHCRQTSISAIAIRLFFRSLLLIFPFWQFSLNTSLCHYRSALHIPFSQTSPSDFHFGHCRWKPLLVFVNLHNPFISAILPTRVSILGVISVDFPCFQ